jgi:1,4-alpha-glucan branching enzyme
LGAAPTTPAADSLQSIIRPAAAPSAAADAAPVLTQFVFDGTARRVVLVGDFNNWDDHATPLVREPGSTLWSVTLPVARGRHIYAFLVDSTWTVDKRAPVARDPDFGVTGSVILVGRP